jgi:hypothetical protein
MCTVPNYTIFLEEFMRSKFLLQATAVCCFTMSFSKAFSEQEVSYHEKTAAELALVESAKEKLLGGFFSLPVYKPGEIVSLLIGINYEKTSSALSNCIKDIDHVLNLMLKPKLGIQDTHVLYMSDKRIGTPFYPTKANILLQLNQFSKMLNQTKVGYFHYSGHGTRVNDVLGDEADGFDEALVPVDYDKSGVILDDQMYSYFVKSLNKDVKLFVVTDCCHSGTILDLPYLWNEYGSISKEHKISQEELDALPTIISISGCKDTQTSADGGPLTINKEGSGALTAAFLTVLKNTNFNLTYRQLLTEVNLLLKKYGFDQRPQLSSTKALDLDAKVLGLSRALVAAE